MRVHVLLLVAVLAIGGCADPDADSADSAAAPAAEVGTTPADEPTQAMTEAESGTGQSVAATSSDLGEILVDGEGMTLYLFLNDEQGASTCYDDCEATWPPLLGPAEAADGVDPALLGEVERDDGSMQATYNDWPLYYFAPDAQAGDLKGQGVGDVWFAVDASGEPVKKAAGDEGARDY